MAPVQLKSFELSVDCEGFLHKFWFNIAFFERFLIEKLMDVGVEIGEWKSSGDHPFNRQRTVRSLHPSKISFPGLPSHAESIKNQLVECHSNGTNLERVRVKETNSFRGIPYSDYFHVIVEWDVKARPLSSNNNGSREKPKVAVTVSLDFKFLKSTWLQGTIESNTKAELMEVYELWINFANEFLQHDIEFAAQLTGEDKTHSVLYNEQGSMVEGGQGRLSPTNGNRSLASSSRESIGSVVSATNKRRMGHRRGATKDDSGDEEEEEAFLSGDDDDMMFYDCEEGDQFPVSNDHFGLHSPPRGASSSSLTSHSLYQRVVPPPTPPDLRRLYPSRSLESLSGSSHGGNSKQDHGYHKNSFDETEDEEEEPTEKLAESAEATQQRNSEAARRKRYQNQLREYRHGSTRDRAIQVVETIFVLLEFTFWQIYQFYCYELKDLFDTTPDQVWSRCINAFLPGWHGSILAQPDLYGPLLGVFFLPLTLLWSTQTSRHGCNPTSQLGNAFIVSLLIWIGLSGVYRGLSMIIAPQILYKHCLSIVGYSFVCWNLALLCSLMLEPFKDMLPLVNAYLPLVLLGLPSSIAQGLMFWELTPASSMTLEPSVLPQSMQQCAAHNSRLIQRFLWALPKILAFVIIAGTHYQLLWYLARVFLPGRRQLCQLSALVRPARYAEILAQKDLRVFAVQLLTGES